MILFPAVDLKNGQCVRLEQGDMATATVFSDDPGKTAAHWASLGARRLHVVDLNGAFAGKPVNEAAIKAAYAIASPEKKKREIAPETREKMRAAMLERISSGKITPIPKKEA